MLAKNFRISHFNTQTVFVLFLDTLLPKYLNFSIALCVPLSSRQGPVEHKIPFLNKAVTKLDIIKFFVQLVWENKLITTEKYSDLLSNLEEIGRQLGGWNKGVESRIQKTPRPWDREKT